MRYYTPKTLPADAPDLLCIRAGATWIYTDSTETFDHVVHRHAERLAEILSSTPLSTFQYLAVLARKDDELAPFERKYIQFLANAACRAGLCEKMLCCAEGEQIYASYLANCRAPHVEAVLAKTFRRVADGAVARFKAIAGDYFDGKKGSYYWAKSVGEHLVHLGLAAHNDQWSIRGAS